jgi:hypothetical protein
MDFGKVVELARHAFALLSMPFYRRVISYNKDSGFYEILDADDNGRLSLPESQVFFSIAEVPL